MKYTTLWNTWNQKAKALLPFDGRAKEPLLGHWTSLQCHFQVVNPSGWGESTWPKITRASGHRKVCCKSAIAWDTKLKTSSNHKHHLPQNNLLQRGGPSRKRGEDRICKFIWSLLKSNVCLIVLCALLLMLIVFFSSRLQTYDPLGGHIWIHLLGACAISIAAEIISPGHSCSILWLFTSQKESPKNVSTHFRSSLTGKRVKTWRQRCICMASGNATVKYAGFKGGWPRVVDSPWQLTVRITIRHDNTFICKRLHPGHPAV